MGSPAEIAISAV
ncbi:MAG: hypothetical protein EZS28_039315, partial [Streblomastix strix]